VSPIVTGAPVLSRCAQVQDTSGRATRAVWRNTTHARRVAHRDMRVIAYSRYGGPDVLELVDLPEPKVGPDSVLVRVRASSMLSTACQDQGSRAWPVSR